jgi:hypothetical protein
MGAMTGRRAGYCAGSAGLDYAFIGRRRGFGTGAGRGGGFRSASGGRGWRNQYFATGLPGWMRSRPYGGPVGRADWPADQAALKRRSQVLQSELDAINKQLDDMQ